MIDLIIPVYKNVKGLMRSLESVNFKVFQVTVIEDGSKEIHKLPYPVKIIRLKNNVGPGQARQEGIRATSNPYIMFLDAGDVFLSKEIQEEMAQIIAKNPKVNVFFWKYLYNLLPTDFLDNRLHGKVYKRAFLKQYNIHFSKAGSYLDEDIGFNRICRIVSKAIKVPIYYLDTPIIEWIRDDNSITQKDKRVSLYRDQTRGLSINTIHCINICRDNNLNEYLIQHEINEIAIALYYWFIRTAAERPEYMRDAWKGARIFYKRYGKNIQPNIVILGSHQLVKCLRYRDKIKFTINFTRFINDMLKHDEMPSWYK